MRSIPPLSLLLLALVLALPVRAQQVNVIPPSGQWVTDQAGLLTPAEVQALSEKLRTHADSTSTQIVIVTLPTLDGVPAADYATALGRVWKVGQAGTDNGAVILVSRDDRQIFIATGYGLEGAITDAQAGRIVRDILVPNFKQGDFYNGLSEATDALLAAARGEFEATAPAPRAARGRSGGGLDCTTLFVVLIIAFFVLNALRKGGGGGRGGHRGRRRRGFGGPPVIIWGGGGFGGGGGSFGGFGGGGGGGFGGFSGGGGSFGGGGAGGSW